MKKIILISFLTCNISLFVFAQDPVLNPNTYTDYGTEYKAQQQEELKTYQSTSLGDASKKGRYLYDTSLMQAVKGKDADGVRTLLQARVDPNEKNDEGFTPIMKASELGSLAIVKHLVEYDADVNGASAYSISALMAAAAGGHSAVVSYLLENGAQINAKDALGKTAMIHAVQSNGDAATIMLLAKAGGNIEDVNEIGDTPIIIAINNDNDSAASALVALGANLDRTPRTAVKHRVNLSGLWVQKL
ncbi:ankyrin repeat protein [Elusimicrobium posterum]|uniref:ankyrin repeat domain-containing protein n=1 Tax=Elusimicrobium posterum TaxID=3116653 RepID=UPI003C787716